MAKQLSFLKPAQKAHGGSLRKSRKGRGARPLSRKSSLHLVVRSTKAAGAKSFSRHHSAISKILHTQARQTQIKLVRWANAGNHLHLHIQLPNHVLYRDAYKRFIRAITGLIARKVLAAERSAKKIQNHKDRFWDLRPYTRLLSSWREFKTLTKYVHLNQFEAVGVDRAAAREILKTWTGAG